MSTIIFYIYLFIGTIVPTECNDGVQMYNIIEDDILKTFSWRFVGTLDTILIGWLISGNAFIGLKIGVAEVITKLILYYLHEKVWYTSNFGLENRSQLTNE